MTMTRKAMIFAAGLGTRLRPLTDKMPKALVPVCGRPLIRIVLDRLVSYGYDDIVVNVHHFAEQVEEYLRDVIAPVLAANAEDIGQKVELNLVTRQMKVSQTDAIVDAVWHNNLIPLDQANMFRIADILEKLYGVDIILSPDIDRTATYSGVLKKKDTIDDVLKILQNTIHINYKINQGTVFISSEE